MFKFFKKKPKDDIPLPPSNLTSPAFASKEPLPPVLSPLPTPQPVSQSTPQPPLFQPLEINPRQEVPEQETPAVQEKQAVQEKLLEPEKKPNQDLALPPEEHLFDTRSQEPKPPEINTPKPAPISLPENNSPTKKKEAPPIPQYTPQHKLQATKLPDKEQPTEKPPKQEPEPESLLESPLEPDFKLPDFEDDETTEHLEELPELPSEEMSIPVEPKKMSIFIRAFDYSRIMAEKKRITLLISQTYKDTEEINRISKDQNTLFEQWYGQLNSCQEKLMQIDNNLFEKYT